MRTKRTRTGFSWLMGLMICIFLMASWAAESATNVGGDLMSPSPRELLAWKFQQDGDLLGWQPNGDLADVRIEEGALQCRGNGSDPILVYEPLLDLPTSPWQMLEVRLKADHDGTMEYFWSNTTQTRYGGFLPGKQTQFAVTGDGAWHTYRVLPFWHPEGRIVRLRLDFYDGTRFALDSIRILELAMLPASDTGQFDFANGSSKGWQIIGRGELAPSEDRLSLSNVALDAFLLAPPIQLDATRSYVTLRMATDAGQHATLMFASSRQHGLQAFSFPIRADGKEHIYNLDLLAAPAWQDQIVALGLRPSDSPTASVQLKSIQISTEPQGPPQLEVVSFGVENVSPRVGIPAEVRAVISNVGGQTAQALGAVLHLPDSLKMVSDEPQVSTPSLSHGETWEVAWRVHCDAVSHPQFSMDVSANNADSVHAETTADFIAPRQQALDYVPEPQPQRGKYEVGVYYFPGWHSWTQWYPISRFPERKPMLGWYHEGDPEVADWHIRWAVEHGITFFAYDWYWVKGARQLEQALHRGYLQSRYRHLLKFCLLWANHNPRGTSSLEDCIDVTHFWMDHYFGQPEYLTVDGKPVIIIFSPYALRADMSSEGVREAFERMRAECQARGLPGLYLLACVGGVGDARQAAAEGYDAVTGYNWPTLGMAPSELWAPFDTLVDAYRRNWQQIIEQVDIPLLPPVCGGWDSRPWHGAKSYVRSGRTPELFRRHLTHARQFLEEQVPSGKALPLALIEAWNEWGEGSYIEPHREFGFGYLDAIRDVFTDSASEHPDLVPEDCGLGPYEVERQSGTQTSWDFAEDNQG